MDTYQTLFEKIKAPLFIALPPDQELEFNPAGLSLFGYTKADAAGLTLSDLYADTNQYETFQQKLRQNGSVSDFAVVLKKKDGTTIDGVISVTTQTDDSGKILSYHGIVRDNSHRKQAEQALQAYNQRLEQEIEERAHQYETQIEQLTALNTVMQMVAAGRDLQATLKIVAREMVRIFKASHSEIALLNADWTQLEVTADFSRETNSTSNVGLIIPLSNNPPFKQVVAIGEMVVVSEAQTNILLEIIHGNLQARNTYCLMILPLLSRGEVIGTIEIDLDDPEREFTYEEVALGEMVAVQIAGFVESARLFDQDMHRAYKQLQELDRLKSAFIGVITHELRSPFVAAELSAQLVTRYAQHQMFDELQRQIKQLQDELAEGRRAIDNVISFASLVGKKQKLYLEEADMAAVIKDAITPLKEMAKTRKINLKVKLDAHLPPVQVDKERMNEAIYHLVYNAIKYNRQGGSVEIACHPTEEQLVFKVQDTGVGVPEDKLNTIWDAFAQNSDDLKRGVEGLGLGLALVKVVINAHGGQVAASSTSGEGSVFGFRIPLQQNPEQTEA